jgi:hypothetical protein
LLPYIKKKHNSYNNKSLQIGRKYFDSGDVRRRGWNSVLVADVLEGTATTDGGVFDGASNTRDLII